MRTRQSAICRNFGLGAIVTGTWLFTIFRAIPERNGDRGIFVSMAERVAAGDRLYVGAWDNKDPLFYFILGIGRYVSPLSDPVIEILWILVACIAVVFITRYLNWTNAKIIFLSFVAVPIILTGSSYVAGFTHLPGISVSFVAIALSLYRRWILAGVSLGLLLFLKILLFPIGILLVLVILLKSEGTAKYRLAAVTQSLFGLLVTISSFLILLLFRGEFGGYFDMLRRNSQYSQSDVADTYALPIWSHFESVLTGPNMVIVMTSIGLLALASSSNFLKSNVLWFTALASLAGALFVIGVSGLWWHHGQVLAIPAVLSLTCLGHAFDRLDITPLSWLISMLALSLVLTGGLSFRAMADNVLSSNTRLQDLSRIADSTIDLLANTTPGSYTRLGQNTDDAHAQGLGQYALVCGQFLQFPYDDPSVLLGIPNCLPSADYILVDKEWVPIDGSTTWNEFVYKSEKTLNQFFECKDYNWGQLCVKKTNVAADN